MPKRKSGFTRDAARRLQAIRKRESRIAETQKETMAQRSLGRRTEKTEQNNSRLSVMAQRGQERRAEETEGETNKRMSAMMPKKKRGVAGDAACKQQANMKRERRVAAADEERNRRFSTMAKSGQDKRTK
ncbi:hypothetical protein AVEN_15735-1 [Araneus ventricosus]|uniref:Uncharacterized protein n=1 Tax=Araneus ventricosus TaxID=182803 RepID=A0A4Y2B874_ARAVE|nr:hypothetical protein AVEN_15735-1 [Araneus ventricosus]